MWVDWASEIVGVNIFYVWVYFTKSILPDKCFEFVHGLLFRTGSVAHYTWRAHIASNDCIWQAGDDQYNEQYMKLYILMG